jgi:hypothetical protein
MSNTFSLYQPALVIIFKPLISEIRSHISQKIRRKEAGYPIRLPPASAGYARAGLTVLFFACTVGLYIVLKFDMKRFISSGVNSTMSSDASRAKLCVSE